MLDHRLYFFRIILSVTLKACFNVISYHNKRASFFPKGRGSHNFNIIRFKLNSVGPIDKKTPFCQKKKCDR